MVRAAAKPRLPTSLEWVALTAGSIAALPATWWLLGRLDDAGESIVNPDYAVRPPQIDRTLAHAIGGAAVGIAVVALALLFVAVVRGRWHGCVAGLVIPLTAGAAYAGLMGHVMTAPVIGANIGAGFVAAGAVPVWFVVVGVMESSWKDCRRIARRAPPPDPTPTPLVDRWP